MRAWFKRLLLRLVFGRGYGYFRSSMLKVDMRGSHYVDILVRKGGQDRRVEADWLKNLQRILKPWPKMRATNTAPLPAPGLTAAIEEAQHHQGKAGRP